MGYDYMNTFGAFHLTKTIRFESAHYLRGLPEGHKCSAIHGHSWVAEVIITGHCQLTGYPPRVADPGMLVDFSLISSVKDLLDHKLLNDLMEGNPTSENVAVFITALVQEKIKAVTPPSIDAHVLKVKVEETCTSACEFFPQWA